MRKVVFILLVLFFAPTVSSQNHCCYIPRGENNYNVSGYIGNGGGTPRGDLRLLIVFVTHGEKYDTIEDVNWPVGSRFPKWITERERKAFYSSFSEFSQNVYLDTTRMSFSNFYYQMSSGQFRVIAEYYPDTVTVELTPNDGWGSINTKALKRISQDFNWSIFDNRTNEPNYQIDCSNSNPDGKIDYVIFCHRLQWSWDTLDEQHKFPTPMRRYPYRGADGFDRTGVSDGAVGGGYTVVSSGFTQMTGSMDPLYLYPHEIGHRLYEGPHYNGCNGVSGRYFLCQLRDGG